MSEQATDELILLVSKGDEAAFRTLFNSYSGRIYGFALKLTRSVSLSEEIVQEVFTKIWVTRETLTSIDYFAAYIYTVTRNHTYNVLKRLATEERAKIRLIEKISVQDSATEDAIIYRDYERVLNKVIDSLPPQQKLVYSLCHQQGLKYEEAAQQLKISRFTVKTHMQQALRTIRLNFGEALLLGFGLFL